ncbi:uncharacterized protein FIBRA_08305 [Fibroporia radiculosa]|uniref:Pterin-binding domain-containing protein n=1 Tax=Fibroporia radiculosa TaxID=599839 RepID=J4GH25_9APHY|nr:uncharacterized protein FIBRA_08305 [Fibroporia radiculosa]CCM06058.1 predicted protein [Fibroporia radiculosa]
MAHNTRSTASADDLSSSIDYSSVLASLVDNGGSQTFSSMEALNDWITERCFHLYPALQRLSVDVARPKALLHASTAGMIVSRSRSSADKQVRYYMHGLECQTIIGVNNCEREEKQRVRFNILLKREDRHTLPLDFKDLARAIAKGVETSSYLTLEALASSVARSVLNHSGTEKDYVTVRAAKPSALPLADAAEVEITRTLHDYKDTIVNTLHDSLRAPVMAVPSPTLTTLLAEQTFRHGSASFKHRAAIALGANIGDRFANIELALRLLEAPMGSGSPRAAIVDTSFMYETAPMYVTDQPKFANCACMIETDMAPLELLKRAKEIESIVGRIASFRNGPRAIDVDILTFDSLIMDSRLEPARGSLDNLEGELVIPHPRIAEREFVLRPLNDMVPDYVHPKLGKSIRQLFTELSCEQPADSAPMCKVMPFPRYPISAPSESQPFSPTLSNIPTVPSTATYWKFPLSSTTPIADQKVYIMGTLNATPDSFSDGSLHNTVDTALAYTRSAVANGADVIDIGGYSTRPGAEYVSPEEERSRVVPVIETIRNDAKVADVLLSVDTFRADVASAAVLAGANCINDVYAFTGPEYPLTPASAAHFLRMRAVARNLAVPVVLMHSRGEASANKDYSTYADAHGRGAVLEGVRVELGEKVDAAVKGPGGLRRWLVLVDPGIGFSKTVEGNIELLGNAARLTAEPLSGRRNLLAGYPQLIGTSRKSFLGAILARGDGAGGYMGRETRPDERGWATAAAVSCAVRQNAAVIRVHDVLEQGDAIRVSAAIWNQPVLCN